MKLAMLTTLDEAEMAAGGACGYDGMEVLAFAGPMADKDLTDADMISKIQAASDTHGLPPSSLFIMGIPLTAEYDDYRARAERSISVCKELGILLTLLGPHGYDPELGMDGNAERFKAVYGPFVKLAEAADVKMAFEHWPCGIPYSKGSAFSATPEQWHAMFDALPSDHLGLEFDPSHLMWQGIDPYKAIEEFKDKIFIAHIKDCEFIQEKIDSAGWFSGGWWRYRLPGYGVVDWERYIRTLQGIGFDGWCVVEHEDPVFSGDRRIPGFEMTAAFMKEIMPSGNITH